MTKTCFRVVLYSVNMWVQQLFIYQQVLHLFHTFSFALPFMAFKIKALHDISPTLYLFFFFWKRKTFHTDAIHVFSSSFTFEITKWTFASHFIYIYNTRKRTSIQKVTSTLPIQLLLEEVKMSVGWHVFQACGP